MEISQHTNELIRRYEIWARSLESKEIGTIHVDEVASKVASFYEKIRGIIDWKEEHLLKRGAIERSLKRKIFANMDVINGELGQVSIDAESLIFELIRGGHFPNDTIEEEKIPIVQNAINKYLFILKENNKEIQFCNWLFSIAACEIEEILSPSIKERALINYMFSFMQERIKLNEGVLVLGAINEKEKNIQTYIAVQKALFDLDTPVISYHLLKYRFPSWKTMKKKETEEAAKNIKAIKEKLEKDLEHNLGDKFYQICKKYNTAYLIVGDIAESEPLKIRESIKNPETLEALIKKFYNDRLKNLRSRLTRAAFYSTLSIFLTNIVALLAIEIPLTKIIGIFNPTAIAIDIFVPTFLMAFLVITIKPPPKENLDKAIMEIMKIIYKKEKEEIYEIKILKKRGGLFSIAVQLFYSAFFILIVGIIAWGLYKIKFPPLSYFIFIAFISLIAFAGTKIREKSKELHMIEEKEGMVFMLLESLSIPVIQFGRWLTIRWKKYNVISVFFSALIDMPFLTFVEFLEQWRYFIREKKEKIY